MANSLLKSSLFSLLLPATLAAQSTVTGSISRVVAGDTVPAANAMVTLHRVDLVEGQPLDSSRSDRSGRYRFEGVLLDTTALFIVSADYAGIGYFTNPIPVRGDTAGRAERLFVYDTTSVGAPLSLAQRHIIVSPSDGGVGVGVLELIILRNTGDVTRVAADSSSPVWTGVIPPQAQQFRVGASEVSDQAIVRSGSDVLVSAPIPPGTRQLVYSYMLPVGMSEVDFRIDQPTSQMIVLVDSRTNAEGVGVLEDLGSRAIGEANYRQYQGADLVPGGTFTLEMAGPAGNPTAYIPLIAALTAVAMATGLLLRLRAKPSAAPAAIHPDALAARIAALDAQFEAIESPTDEQKSDYRDNRAELKRILADALDKSDSRA